MSEQRDVVWAEEVGRALGAPDPVFVTLARGRAVPPDLLGAIESFAPGTPHPAGTAAVDWLQSAARSGRWPARVRVVVADGRVLAFYALASTHVRVTTRDRRRYELGEHPRVPAALVAWLARGQDTRVSGDDLLRHAVAKARQADQLQATSVLALDPFDEATGEMWIRRFGFRRAATPIGAGERPEPLRRLWLPLDAI